MLQTASAATTNLADVPIAAKIAAKPNIVYTVDDSGSMTENYAPEDAVLSYCRGGSGTAACGGANYVIPLATGSTYLYPPLYAADYNHMAYNPNINYQPPVKYDGTPLTGAFTDAQGNQTNFAKVQSDPFLSPATTVSLTGNVVVPFYCNSDWPLDTSIGLNGEYVSGKGNDCRIDGTKYDAAANGGPAVNPDYNYPWSPNTAIMGAQYYYRTGLTKTLWCDPTNAGWPTQIVNNTCVAKCASGVPTTTSVPGVWGATGNVNSCCVAAGNPAGCPGASTYTPAGCNNSTTYCAPGKGVAPECIGGCSCNTQVSGRTGNCTYVNPNGGPNIVIGQNCTGAGCTAVCPNINIATGCTGGGTPGCAAQTAYCNAYLNGSTTTTLFDDANLTNGGTGAVCRHNNQAYGVTPAGSVTYGPAGNGGMVPWNTGLNTNSNTTVSPGPGKPFPNPYCTSNQLLLYGCKNSAGTNTTSGTLTNVSCVGVGNPSIPRHYYTIASVQYCKNSDGVNNDQWRGFGLAPCQAKNDFTTYKFVQYGQFNRVDLVNDGRLFNYVDQVTGAASTRTYAQETTNYANWYSYYRTRILATKTTSSLALALLDNTYRVGFQDLGQGINAPPAPAAPAIIWVNVRDFSNTLPTPATSQKNYVYTAMFALNPTNFKTPTMDAMLRVGNLFQTGGVGGLGATVNPLPGTDTTGAATADPIQYSCQPNYHILFTDGFTNQTQLPAVFGDQDATIPVSLDKTAGGIPWIPPINTLPDFDTKSGQPWQKPFVQGVPAMGNTLSDISTYYWATDLRPAMTNNVPSAAGVNDLNPAQDVAWWQHVNFSAILFGSDGVLDASNQASEIAALTSGAKTWPMPQLNANSPNTPAANPGATGADDLWHATVNARGAFVFARSPLEVQYGLASILAGIQNQRKSRIGAAFSGQVLNAGNDIIYESTIEPGWAGDLRKVQVDPTTGIETATLWQASTTLAAQIKPVLPTDEPWFTNRRIVTINSSSGAAKPFLFANLSAAQLASLSPDPTTQQKIIAYLRGGSTFNAGAQVIEGTSIGQFRKRFGPLGDITNAQPVVVVPPDPTRYNTGADPGYPAFAAAQASRPQAVYAAANDGMLHAFDAATGNENWAFIPKALFRGVAGNILTVDNTAIQALTYQDGGVPIYHHHFYVDSSPRVNDIDFSNTVGGSGPNDWHTILVGGLGKGGNSYYALDVTNPAAADENAAAAKVLWEVTLPDVTYTYSRPVIVKTRAYGWVVIVASGYDNPTGIGQIFFLNARNGNLLKTMSTGVGTAGTPSGLAQISAYGTNKHNVIAEQIYGGDLLGNVWRFDVSNASAAAWTVTQFATLVDPSGAVQPVTTAPQIEIDFFSGVNRYVFVGTGQLLDPSDLTSPSPPQAETFYAFRDGTISNPQTTGLPISTARGSTPLKPINPDGVSAIVGGAPNGWYQDLPATPPDAERIVVDPESDVNIALYIGTAAQTDPCSITLPATVYAREYASAKSLVLDSGGNVIPSITLAGGAVGGEIVGLTQSNGSLALGGILSPETPTGVQTGTFANPVGSTGRRLSWRLLQQN